ncbi:MAG: hypothetical protein RR902_03675 [Oscillospiraceae bacterium]
MTLSERASYIKGLSEGLCLDSEKKEVKVINALLDLVSEMAVNVQDLGDDMDQVYDEIDAIDEDMTDIEDYLWEDEDEDDDDCDCDCDDDEVYEITCPNCNEVTCVTEDMLDSEDLACPACGTKFEIDFDACDCDCDDDCDCCHNDKE